MKLFGTSLVRLLLCAALLTFSGLTGVGLVFAQQTSFYFHDDSELTFAYPPFQIQGYQVSGIEANPSSTSARVFQYATPTVPTRNGLALALSANISVSSQPEVYAAFVAWVTHPFPTNVTLDGNVVLHVWMSSSDVLLPWQGSEFFMGLADYSPNSTTPFQLLDDYLSNASIGYNGFTSSPNEYVISTLQINQHKFAAGSMLMFFVGVGSNKQGYSFTVYFDSSTWDSRADMPFDPTLAVAEFHNLVPLVFAVIVLCLASIKHRSTRQQ